MFKFTEKPMNDIFSSLRSAARKTEYPFSSANATL